jgi:hypothetical protein
MKESFRDLQGTYALSAALVAAFLLSGAVWTLVVALLIIVGNVLELSTHAVFAKWFHTLSHAVGVGITNILLFCIFFVVVTPLALIYRAVNDELARKFFKKDPQTYFTETHKTYGPDMFRNVW